MPRKKHKPFQFPVPRYRAPDIERPMGIEFMAHPDVEEVIGEIQGKTADSPEEWRVAKALVILGRNFLYQYLVGLAGIAGSYIVDFIVEDAPRWFPLEVQSERWHTGKYAEGEDIREKKIERTLMAEVRYVYEEELQTQSDAVSVMKEVLYTPGRRRSIYV